MAASKEMAQPSVFGQAIIVVVYVPILSLTGVFPRRQLVSRNVLISRYFNELIVL
jgi:hypothetical protein